MLRAILPIYYLSPLPRPLATIPPVSLPPAPDLASFRLNPPASLLPSTLPVSSLLPCPLLLSPACSPALLTAPPYLQPALPPPAFACLRSLNLSCLVSPPCPPSSSARPAPPCFCPHSLRPRFLVPPFPALLLHPHPSLHLIPLLRGPHGLWSSSYISDLRDISRAARIGLILSRSLPLCTRNRAGNSRCSPAPERRDSRHLPVARRLR